MFNAFNSKTQNVYLSMYRCTYVAGYVYVFKAHNYELIENVYYILSHLCLSETYDPTCFVLIRSGSQTPR